MGRYRVYGLRVRSPWRLAGCRVLRPAGQVDVTIRAGSAAPGPRPRGPWFQHRELADGSDWLAWHRLGEFVVSADGRTVTARPHEPAGPEAFQSYLLAQVLSFALVRRGLEPLHATAVVVDGQALGFLGPCGAGKSTLAAAWLARGARLLTDDALVVRCGPRGVLAHAGPARIKLFPAVARRLLGACGRAPRLNPGTAKRIVALGPAARPERAPVPLRALYVLRPRPAGRARVRRLSPRRAVVELLGSTFNPLLLAPARLARLLDQAATLACRLPVRVLSYPRSLDRLPEVCAVLEADLAG